MGMDSINNGVSIPTPKERSKTTASTAAPKPAPKAEDMEIIEISPKEASAATEQVNKPLLNIEFDGDEKMIEALVKKEKEPSKSTIEESMSKLNLRMKATRCAYSYDEDTKRISIKVYDKDTDELIREVPREESLEALKKVWELAGIMFDEKR